jgi:hypothetical protein
MPSVTLFFYLMIIASYSINTAFGKASGSKPFLVSGYFTIIAQKQFSLMGQSVFSDQAG